MKKIYILTIIVYFPIYSMHLARINHSQFKELIQHSKNYLKHNINNLACQKNESGFIRINIPISDESKIVPSLKKLRFNYRAPEKQEPI